MPRATKTAPKRAGATWRSWFLGAIMIAGLAAIVLHFGEVRNFALLVLRAEPLWLLLAVLLQLSTYASVASGWSLVLSRAGTPRPLRKLIPIAVTKLFADQAVPAAGAAGNILLVDQLVGLGVPRGTAVGALLLSVIGYFIAFALFALAMLFVLWLHNEATALMAGVVTMFLLVALAVPSLALWLRHRGSRPLSRRIEHIGVVRKLLEVVGQAPKDLVSDRRLLVGVSACNGLVFLADAATLWACLHALGGGGIIRHRLHRVHHVLDRGHARPAADGARQLRGDLDGDPSAAGDRRRGGLRRYHIAEAAYPLASDAPRHAADAARDEGAPGPERTRRSRRRSLTRGAGPASARCRCRTWGPLEPGRTLLSA